MFNKHGKLKIVVTYQALQDAWVPCKKVLTFVSNYLHLMFIYVFPTVISNCYIQRQQRQDKKEWLIPTLSHLIWEGMAPSPTENK